MSHATTIKSIKNAVKNNETGDEPLPKAYHLAGFPLAIGAFIYEIIPALEEHEFVKKIAAYYLQRVVN